jgi:ribonuclease BN (tRNA processing enzyme)
MGSHNSRRTGPDSRRASREVTGIMRRYATAAAIAVTLMFCPAAQAAGDAFITLGTGAGPTPRPDRAQPANLLLAQNEAMLIDVGDGAATQVARAGVPMDRVRTILISHLHFDHTGGLFAFISRRYQALVPGLMTIYGPPGTRATVDGMLAAMRPALAASSTIRARAGQPLESTLKVIEISDGWTGIVAGVRITAAANSHYATLPDAAPTKHDTFAFRFDTPRRSIVYTGDTGPSAAVEALARGADILFCEILDPEPVMRAAHRDHPELTAAAAAIVEAHMRLEHLAPSEVGLLAERAGVKALVLTHDALDDGDIPRAKRAIRAHYKGPVTFARDLQRF